ncbi:GNAT family N-acetyltransferase [Actinomadura darangshiensis]|uniref:GNAT family N-acetyltransferase n=1 Tax=Actinomadura darangshiensis TaxID=705336 RepID=A0A4R5ALD1_9ACTN|nr:GNAT family N-acetyltransferase [Actinomadura darangshiensis]TDD73511.1 GNAT family N-acetyltransferase [Actinomadura darangshiensis]
MSTLSVRQVRQDDAPRVNELFAELGHPENTDDEVTARLAHWNDSEDLLPLAAVHDGRVVGVIALAVVPFFERPGSWGRVVALVVDAQSRGLGVGRRLMEAAEEAARTRGCIRMEVTSARYRTDAQAFYPAIGYTDQCDKSARYLKNLVPDYANR